MVRKCMGCMNDYDDGFEVCPHCGYVYGTDSNESYHLQPTTIIGKRYIIGKVLGYGGFGVTYLGWDAILEQKVAIKEYFPNEFCTRVHGEEKISVYSGSKKEQFESGMEKFLSESKCLSKLIDVEGIVKIQDCFEENNTAYIIMEYLEGKTLKQLLEEEKKIDVDSAIVMIKPILEALDKVHEEGILHRDIAPDNIFITDDGRIKVIDFGASRFATTKHSKSLSVILKPGYSPEEQYRSGGDQGPWTDVYAVAATFYKMITGITPDDAMERNANDKLKEPSKLGVKLGKNTENSIMNALNVKVEGRTNSAKAFLRDLEAEEVKRIKIKNIKMDIGKMPLWAKISSSVACVSLLTFLTLIATGVIHFDTKKVGANYLPEGYTRVPNVINMTNEDAEQACRANQIILQVYGKEYSDSVEEDKILGQQLYGGSIVEENTTLLVLASAGAEKIMVPDVVGYMETDATTLLDDTDLVYTCKYLQSCFMPGAVISQSIEANQLVEAGTMLDLEISTGMNYDVNADTEVPKLVESTMDEAIDSVEASALYIFKAGSEYSTTIPKGVIISQSPVEGTAVKQGDVVEVIVSLGPEMVLVPDVQYKSLTEAQSTLEEAGFVVKVEYQDDELVMKDHVISQSEQANSLLEKGNEIIIYISNGNEEAVINTAEVSTDNFITQTQQEEYEESQKQDEDIIVVTNNDNSVDTGENSKPSTEYAPVEEVTMVSVPALSGMTESQAVSTLSGCGLVASVSYSHNEDMAHGTVMGQNISSGTSVAKGSTINISVCNNETKTEYRSRNITEETATSSASSMAGWELYDTTDSWSDYGAWSWWDTTVVEASDSRNVESKTQYNCRYKETTSSSSSTLDGWTQTGSEITSYSAWSDNKTTTTAPTTSSTLQIISESSKTTYNYYHYDNTYTDGTHGIDSVASGSGNGQTIKKNNAYHTYSTTTALSKVSFQDIGGKQGYGSHACANNWNYWFYSGSTTTTTYTYQTREPIYTYYYERWSDWMGWWDTDLSTGFPSRYDVQTRTVYRYQDRSLITTYHYKRDVYGTWSSWSETPCTASDTLDVETREVFIY